uniref:Forkhead box protein N3 n=1 Tax=Oncorhynchus mykiss TaxID=8022 RepID=A0A8C7RDD7_ONCMY
MGPVMPPSKKPEVSGISVASASMSHLYQTGSLSRALQEAEELDLVLPVHLALPLAPLPGGAAKPEKGTATPGMEDEELTNLNWLHESKNLLNSFGDPVLRSVSPVGGEGGGTRDGDPDDTPPSPSMVGGDLPYDAQRNPNCKPPYSFSCLIFMAIEDAPSKRLPVKEIYNWILEHFPYFANAPTGWKNSVRHNLSLNKCFKKVDKDRSQSIGKGSLWCVDPEYRQNLIQALKKTPYHPHAQVFSTPPTSPQAYQSPSGSDPERSQDDESGTLPRNTTTAHQPLREQDSRSQVGIPAIERDTHICTHTHTGLCTQSHSHTHRHLGGVKAACSDRTHTCSYAIIHSHTRNVLA